MLAAAAITIISATLERGFIAVSSCATAHSAGGYFAGISLTV
jgi:hypothetical protein